MRLFGRESDLGVVVDFVLDTTRSRPPALLVTGEPGIGKTAILDAVVPIAEQHGRTVHRLSGVEYEADLLFGGLNQLLNPLRDRLSAVSATHRQALEIVLGLRRGRPPSELVVGAAVLSLIESVPTESVEQNGQLFVVDDAALVDRASAMTIAYVARRADGSRVRFLLAARADVENAFVRSGFDVYVLRPLSHAGADALLAARFPDLPLGARRRVREAAEGNPLALLDLPVDLGLQADPLPEVVPLGDRLRALYTRQLNLMPPTTREALLSVALAGSETEAVARRLLSVPGRDLGAAERLGLVRVDAAGSGIEFRHPLIRAAVVDASTADDRHRAHARLAELFRDDPRRRAWHLGESTTWPDPEVADELERLADELLTAGAAHDALSSALRSAELTEDRQERARRIGRASFLGSVITGDLDASEELLRLARPDPGEPLPLALVAAGAHATMSRDGDVLAAHRLLIAALDAVPSPLPADDPTTQVLNLLLFATLYAGRADLWAQTHRQLDRVDPPVPETVEIFRGIFRAEAAPDVGTLARLDEALLKLVFVSDPLRINRLSTAGAHLDRIPIARRALERVVEDGRSGGAVARQIRSLQLLAMSDWLTGDWEALRERVEEELRLCDELGYALLATTGHYLQALVDAVRGDDLAAEQAVERLLQWAAPRGLPTVAAYASHVQCLRAIGRQDFAAAYRHAASVDPPGVIMSIHPTDFWMIFDLVEAASRSGHGTEAHAHVATAVEAELSTVSPRLDLVVQGAAAVVADQDWSERFTAALAVPGAEQYPFDHARVRLAYGERLRRERLLVAARDQLTQAAAVFEILGTRPWLERATRELRAAGGSPGPHRSELTPQESAIARLAAAGLTNKQIGARLYVSPRTVSTHLSHVFAKLGVTSRHELQDALGPDDVV